MAEPRTMGDYNGHGPDYELSMGKLLNTIREVTGSKPGQSIDPAQVDAAAVGREHVRQTITALLERSELTADAVATGATAIVGATYQLDSGRVVRHSAIGLD